MAAQKAHVKLVEVVDGPTAVSAMFSLLLKTSKRRRCRTYPHWEGKQKVVNKVHVHGHDRLKA